MYLLNFVQDEYEHPSAYGSYIAPGTVERCDGTEQSRPHKPDLSVTFISFPYFDVAQHNPPDAPQDGSLHLTRSLYQYYYPPVITRDQDAHQQFRKFSQAQKGEYLRVPQLWVLILNSTTIISCGPTSLAGTAKDWLEIIPEDSLVGITQQLLHVTDFHKRITILSLADCSSYLQLERTIQAECLSKTSHTIDQCNLHLGNNESILDPALWPSLVKDERTAFLYIRISRKSDTTTAQAAEKARIEAPSAQNLIEYTDLGSDDQSVTGKEVAIYRGGFE
ncbi:hypothetical protein SVAN01_05450 [Stagonosporopsis vannaccii]|nr:hypothetical protein SVAN01_05450 [Stagonosporopsis vannaccii]